jgi:hypothetical protein
VYVVSCTNLMYDEKVLRNLRFAFFSLVLIISKEMPYLSNLKLII